MERLKRYIFFVIIVSFVFVLLASNVLIAADPDYSGTDGVDQIINYDNPNQLIGAGKTIEISYADVQDTNNLYCIAHSRTMSKTTYKINGYVDIIGNVAKAAWGEVQSEDESNNIIAAILGGTLEKGFGKDPNDDNAPPDYTKAQLALYIYWNKWIEAVGEDLGIAELNDEGNEDLSEADLEEATKALEDAKQEIEDWMAKGWKHHVRIYFLTHAGEKELQHLIIAIPELPELDEPDQSTIPEPEPYTGKAYIKGTVWEDEIIESKAYQGNNEMDSGEKGIKGVNVNWYTTFGGNELLDSATTDSNGDYELSYSIPFIQCNYEPIPETTIALEKVNNSYVEFEYNGLVYTTVKPNVEIDDGSKAIESPSSREKLDKRFDEVTNKGVYDENRVAYKYKGIKRQIDEHTATINQNNSDFAVLARTSGNFLEDEEGNKYINVSDTDYLCINHCAGDGSHCMDSSTGHWTDCNRCNPQYDEDGKLTGYNCPGNDKWVHDCEVFCSSEHCGGSVHTGSTDSNYWENVDVEWTVENVNLGLILKEQVDIGITSDIEKVDVITKGQKYTYKYEYSKQLTDEELYDYKVKFQNREQLLDSENNRVYRRPVNPADIAEFNQNSAANIEIYVTYTIKAKNLSDTLSVDVQEIVNYYDDGYELYNSNDWANTSKHGDTYNKDGFKAVYYQLNEVLKPKDESSEMQVQFKVNPDVIKGLLNEDAPMENVSEIYSYSTCYGSETICSEMEIASVKDPDRTKTQYASIDSLAVPGSAIPGDWGTYERDTSVAPTFLLCMDDSVNKYRVISGTVWEDSATTESTSKNERLGNGVKADSEKGVKNVKVELLKVNDDGTTEIAKLYSVAGTAIAAYPAVTYTDENGNFNFGNNDESNGIQQGVTVDNYILKYTYGNKDEGNGVTTTSVGDAINARNYKSTIITTEPVKGVVAGTNTSDKWHLTATDNASIAVDDLNERASIDSLKYSNFDEGVNMSAYSQSFRLQVEYTSDQIAVVDENGGEFNKNLGIFDFGIIERPKENIVVETIISNLKITLADGQVLTEGNPYAGGMKYVKALGDKQIRNRGDVASAREKVVSLEIDQEIIQGATMDLLYSITVTNNNEYDFEYNTEKGGNNKYYYFGERGSELISSSVEKIVQYLDSELVFVEDAAINKSWTHVPVEDLRNIYISENTFNEIKDKYVLYTTDQFKDIIPGQAHTEQLAVSKMLANQAEEYTFENHAEILEINGAVARTIDRTEGGKQIAKQYKTGNYIPSLVSREYIPEKGSAEEKGLHQQDDDMIKVTITPPTGISENTIIYIKTIAIGLIVIAGAIVFIKKKIL